MSIKIPVLSGLLWTGLFVQVMCCSRDTCLSLRQKVSLKVLRLKYQKRSFDGYTLTRVSSRNRTGSTTSVTTRSAATVMQTCLSRAKHREKAKQEKKVRLLQMYYVRPLLVSILLLIMNQSTVCKRKHLFRSVNSINLLSTLFKRLNYSVTLWGDCSFESIPSVTRL